MLATTLVEYPWLTTVALVVLVVLGPLVGAWLVSKQRVARMLLGASVVALAALTFAPTDRELSVGCTLDWDVPTLGGVELMANVIMFAAVVVLAGVATRRPRTMFFAATGASLLIEGVQAFVTVLGRSCSSNDWLSNTVGAFLGAVLAAAALRLARVTPQRGLGPGSG